MRVFKSAWAGPDVPSKNDPQKLCKASGGKVKESFRYRADYSSQGHQRKHDPRVKLYYPFIANPCDWHRKYDWCGKHSHISCLCGSCQKRWYKQTCPRGREAARGGECHLTRMSCPASVCRLLSAVANSQTMADTATQVTSSDLIPTSKKLHRFSNQCVQLQRERSRAHW